MNLLIPSALFGPYKEVAREARKMARALHRGEDAEQVFSASGLTNQAEHASAMIYTASSGGRGVSVPGFYPGAAVFFFEATMYDHAHDGAEAAAKTQHLIRQLLNFPSGVLALTMYDATLLWSLLLESVREGGTADPLIFEFLEALAKHWDTFIEAGAVYSAVPGQGETLNEANNALKYLAANLGVPPEQAQFPGTAYLEAYAVEQRKGLSRIQS